MKLRRRAGAVAGGALLASVLAVPLMVTSSSAATTPADWTSAGQNAANTHNQPNETVISPSNASKLVQKWSLTTHGDVTDTPAESNGVVYFTDRGTVDPNNPTGPSTLWAVKASNGQVLWSDPIQSYTGITGDGSRETPAITSNGTLILGNAAPASSEAGSWLMGINAATGALEWKTQLDAHPMAQTTSSPTVYGTTAYIGVSSLEEQAAATSGYPCCTFRGSVVAVNTTTGAIQWKSYMAPDNGGQPGGYSGDGVWGSSPAVDPATGEVYVGTGNNYTVPSGVCTQPNETGCAPVASNDYPDSIVALNMKTGAVAWHQSTLSSDASTTACTASDACGPDSDFGSAPNLYTTTNPSTGKPETLLGIGQKSGWYYAVNPSTGAIVWKTSVGPGGYFGGVMWGSATDGNRIYVAEADANGTAYTVNGKSITSGSWAALNAATGAIEWQTPDPQGSTDTGFMSVANGVVYAPSNAATGNNMYALNASTGAVLWGFASGGSVDGGADITNGNVYWGSGNYTGTNNNKIYAFGQ